MKVVVSGSSGFIGSALVPALANAGHTVFRLVRRKAERSDEIEWDPAKGELDSDRLEGIGGVVHLAGKGLADSRWTDSVKSEIKSSRVESTQLLATTVAGLKNRPQVFISASAIGYYGDQGDTMLTESSPVGDGFLAEVCEAWEGATQPAKEAGIRVVNLRNGIVLGSQGGALAKMLSPFRLGLGGKLGSGDQYMSWIALEDLVGVVCYILATPKLDGPVNAVAPNPVTNAEFTKVLGRTLQRPTVMKVPTFAIKRVFGEMGETTLLSSARVQPRKLLANNYRFRFSLLEQALRYLLRT